MKAVKKNFNFSSETGKEKIKGREKLSLAHCKKVLNRNGNNYTDEQIINIRDFLYAMASIDYLFFTEKNLNKCVTLNQNNYEQSSNSLYQSEYRRAS